MTVEIKDSFKVKSKRTDHPNSAKYPGRPSFEFGTAVRKFICDLEGDEYEQFFDGSLVFDEAASAEFFDSILEGDVVGAGLISGLNEKNEPSAHKFKILKIDREKDMMQARDVTWEHAKRKDYQGAERELSFEELSCALGMGFGEILERDGKPYGVSEEIEYTVNIYGDPDMEAKVIAEARAEAEKIEAEKTLLESSAEEKIAEPKE